MHGTGSTVVKMGRALAPRKKAPRVSLHEKEIAASLERMKKLEERIVVEGWIKKRSTSARLNSLMGKGWKKKWVVIDVGGCMSVYKQENKSATSLRFRMYLGGCTVVEQVPGKSFKLKSMESKESGRYHYFRTKTLEEYCKWVMHFRAWEGTKSDQVIAGKMNVASESSKISDDEDADDSEDDDEHDNFDEEEEYDDDSGL